MENQSIEKRYLDRKKLVNLLGRLFSNNYFIEVHCCLIIWVKYMLNSMENPGTSTEDYSYDTKETYRG